MLSLTVMLPCSWTAPFQLRPQRYFAVKSILILFRGWGLEWLVLS
jgi:hypothetical protein